MDLWAAKYGIETEYVEGYQPTLVFYNENDEIVEEVNFSKMEVEQIRNILRAHGYLPIKA